MLLGLSPEDIFDEAVANMICDGVEDLRNGCVKIYYEQDEAKKVNNKVLFCSSNETNYLTSVFFLHPSLIFILGIIRLVIFVSLSSVTFIMFLPSDTDFLVAICVCMVLASLWAQMYFRRFISVVEACDSYIRLHS